MVTEKGVHVKSYQIDLPVAGQAFNLSPETGLDVDRYLQEQRESLAAETAAKAFADKMLAKLRECPGFVAADAPLSLNDCGRIVVEPAQAIPARLWLKRRFEVAENVELSPDSGLAFDIRPRCRGTTTTTIRRKFTGRKAEQFTFAL